jgi:hypothetical protein
VKKTEERMEMPPTQKLNALRNFCILKKIQYCMSAHCGLRTADFLLVISQIFLLEHYSKERVNLADQACIQLTKRQLGGFFCPGIFLSYIMLATFTFVIVKEYRDKFLGISRMVFPFFVHMTTHAVQPCNYFRLRNCGRPSELDEQVAWRIYMRW